MYNELIDVGRDGNVFLIDNSIALMPKMWDVYKDKNMGSNMVRWIVCMYDYKSPYRRLPEDERAAKVNYVVYGDKKNTKSSHQKVLDAIDEYKKLQYDPLIDQYNAMCEQAFKMTKVYRGIEPTETNLEDLNKLQEQMQKAATSRDKIKELILKDEQSEAKISGTGSDDFSIFEEDEMLD
jgi:hypothetical protein